MSNFPLNLFTVSQEMQSSLSWFHRSITLSEKKYFRRSRLHRCFTSLTEWPLVDDNIFLSKSESKHVVDCPISILNISSKSALFRLSSKVYRPSCFNLSLYGISFIPGTILVNPGLDWPLCHCVVAQSTNTGALWPLRNFLIIMVTISVDRQHYR